MEKTIHCLVDGGIARLTLNRPRQANSLGLASETDLADAIERLVQPDVRVVVIGGAGPLFCAGGDISEFVRGMDNAVELVARVVRYLHAAVRVLGTLPVPVISAVNGSLGGAGIALALCADFVLASDTAKLRGGYCGIALSPDLGSSYFLTRRVGAAKAKQIFMLNRAFSAQDCLQMGLFDEVHAPDELSAAVDKLARELAQGPTFSYARVKRGCDSALSQDLTAHLELERQMVLECAASADFREGVAAFTAKRAPQFLGA